MKNLVTAGTLGLVLAVGLAQMLDAAPPRKRLGRPSLKRSTQPVLDPAVNMLNPTNSLETNYLLRTVPEQAHLNVEAAQGRALNQLKTQVARDEARQAANSNLGVTGHTTSFLNYGGYYQLGGAGGAGGSSGPSGRPASSGMGRSSGSGGLPGMGGMAGLGGGMPGAGGAVGLGGGR